MTTGTERSSVLSGRRKEKARSKHVAVESSKPVLAPGNDGHEFMSLADRIGNTNPS